MANKVKKTNAKTKKIPHLYKERNPDNHKIAGKFVGLYVLFALTTVAFAAIAVYLFFFSAKMLEKYEAIDPACRNGRCQVINNNNNNGGDETNIEE